MPKFLDPTGKELTAGQALDVWLEYQADIRDIALNAHVFSDAVYGYPREMKLLKKAGIEIKFGEES